MIPFNPVSQPGLRTQARVSSGAAERHNTSNPCIKEFDPFRLDTGNECLWRCSDHGRGERILLKPKAFGILQYLVDHPGRLVTQGELLDAIWPNTHVQPDVLKRHIFDIRNLLGDDPRHPAYIETRPWRGYQFIATVRDAVSAEPSAPEISAGTNLVAEARSGGRAYLGKAIALKERIVFITGEPRIGQTISVEEFRQHGLRREIERLIRQRNGIDTAIAEFEHLELQLHAKRDLAEREVDAKTEPRLQAKGKGTRKDLNLTVVRARRR